jgi:tetratricopeptide (TPR) repeat protein
MKVSNETGRAAGGAARESYTRARRAARAFVTLVCAAMLLAAAARPCVAQPQTPRIASEAETKEKQPKEKEPRTPAQAPRQQQNTRRGPRTPAPIDVTFKTDLPQSEIFLSRGKAGPMQLLGKTDADGKLTIQLPPGRHEITASRQGARILRQQIKVGPDSNSFSFDLALPKPPPKQEEQASATPTPEAQPSEPVKPPVEFDQLLARFTGGKGDAATADEWKKAHDLKAAAFVKEPDNKRLEAETLLAEGQSAYLRGDHPSAVAAFRKAVIASPGYAAAQYALGNAYLATNQPSKAFDAYGEAVKLDKEMAPAYKGAGDALTRLGRAKEATFYFDRAKGLGQTLPTNTSLAKGRELKGRKRWGDAVTEFEDVAAREPSAEVFIDIGDCYVGLQKSFSAAKAYQKATELDAKNALAYFKSAEVMFNEHEWASAMESYERALALDTTGQQFNRKTARARADEAAKKLAQQKR